MGLWNFGFSGGRKWIGATNIDGDKDTLLMYFSEIEYANEDVMA